MKLYIAAFIATLVVGLSATIMISGTISKDLDNIAESVLSESETEKETETEQSEAPEIELTPKRPPAIQPAVVLTIAPGAQLEAKAEFVAQSVGLGKKTTRGLKRFVSKSMEGLNRELPVSAAMFFREKQTKPTLLLCFPVNDHKAFNDFLIKFSIPFSKNGEKLVAIPNFGRLRMWERGNYVFLSSSREIFDRIPPEKDLFAHVDLDNDISIKVMPERIPAELKQSVFATARHAVINSDEAVKNNEDIRETIRQLQSLIFQTEKAVINIEVDTVKRCLEVVAEYTGTEKSEIAKQAQQSTSLGDSKFCGFRNRNAGFNFGSCSSGTTEDVRAQFKNFADFYTTSQTRQFGNAMPALLDDMTFSKLIDLWTSTLDPERIDYGASLIEKNGFLNFVGGWSSKDATNFRAIVDQFLEQPGARKNVASLNGIEFHQFQANMADHLNTLPHQASHFRDPFTNPKTGLVTFTVGYGPDTQYIGLGEHSLELLQSSINGSANAKLEMGIVSYGDLEYSPFLNFVRDETVDQRYFKSLIRNSFDVDRLSYETRTIPNGFSTQIQIETGFVRISWKTLKRAIDRAVKTQNSGPIRIEGIRGQVPFSSMLRSWAN